MRGGCRKAFASRLRDMRLSERRKNDSLLHLIVSSVHINLSKSSLSVHASISIEECVDVDVV
jgi:hypothetical protein